MEKLQAIVTKYRRHQDSSDEFPLNFMRHYYDIFCLLQNEQVQAFIGTAEYFEQKKPVKPEPIADKSLNSGK